MQKIFTDPTWWMSVVVVGFLINIASSYLKNHLDKALTKASNWWRSRSEKRTKKWKDLIHELSKDEGNYKAAERKLDEHRFRTLAWGVSGVFMLVCSANMMIVKPALQPWDEVVTIMLYGFALLVFVLSHVHNSLARNLHAALEQADDDRAKTTVPDRQ